MTFSFSYIWSSYLGSLDIFSKIPTQDLCLIENERERENDPFLLNIFPEILIDISLLSEVGSNLFHLCFSCTWIVTWRTIITYWVAWPDCSLPRFQFSVLKKMIFFWKVDKISQRNQRIFPRNLNKFPVFLPGQKERVFGLQWVPLNCRHRNKIEVCPLVLHSLIQSIIRD